MPDEAEIYRTDAERYQRLIAREDWQGNLLPALLAALPKSGGALLDLGAGTGRFERLLGEQGYNSTATDLSRPMLHVAQRDLAAQANIAFVGADHRNLPFRAAAFDAVLSGWSVCYLVTWNPTTWQVELDRALGEMRRALRPGGKIILVETLGTGVTSPTPPLQLVQYYDYLAKQGFTMSWLRTDYRFASREEGEELAAFFFGEAMIERLEGLILPECTVVWVSSG